MRRNQRGAQVLGLAGWVGLCLLAGVVGSLATATSLDTWYAALDRPAWSPPDWVFGPVWTLLYVLMGVAAWLVWRLPASRRRTSALGVFIVQLGLNVLWVIIFFGLREPALAAVELGFLWAMIVVALVLFWRIRPLAGALLIPYLAWVSYAATLNVAIWWLNPGA